MSRNVRLGAASIVLGAVLAALALGPRGVSAQPGADGRGADVFASKHCAECHRPRGREGVGPALEELRRPQGAYEFIGRLWNHAPAMFTLFSHQGLAWPTINAAEMASLMAYLGADAVRDPAPSLVRGQLTLVAKGCLKCHAFRGEGAHVAPDLIRVRQDFAPPATWGAKMWSHTPRMAAAALKLGIDFPRFSGDEMVDLIAFLRSGNATP